MLNPNYIYVFIFKILRAEKIKLNNIKQFVSLLTSRSIIFSNTKILFNTDIYITDILQKKYLCHIGKLLNNIALLFLYVYFFNK